MKAFLKRKKIFYSKQVKKIDQVKGLNLFLKLTYWFNVIFAFLLLLACIAPYTTSDIFSFLSLLSLIVPYLVLANIIFLLFWMIKRKRQLLISLSALLLGYFTQGTFVKFFSSNGQLKDSDISLLTFNSHGSMGVRWSRIPSYNDEIADFVVQQDADIVCFQEFRSSMDKNLKQYQFNYQTPYQSGRSKQAIYSKYKILGTGSLDFPNSGNNAIYVDILIKRDTLRIYNLHLQSLIVRLGSFKREQSQRLYKRLSKTFQKQQVQANLVIEHSRSVNYRKIICGDFNNTAFSSVYKIIKGDMNDSFHEKGSGFGNTYLFKFLPFRIDFILTDSEIEIKSHKNFDVRLSDHTPVMASFRLKE